MLRPLPGGRWPGQQSRLVRERKCSLGRRPGVAPFRSLQTEAPFLSHLISGPLSYLLKNKPEIQQQHLETSSCCFLQPWPTTLSPGIICIQEFKQRHTIWKKLVKKQLQAAVQKAGFRTGREIQLGPARVNHLSIFISNQDNQVALTVKLLLEGGWSQSPTSLLAS